jgi:hypothetical protein
MDKPRRIGSVLPLPRRVLAESHRTPSARNYSSELVLMLMRLGQCAFHTLLMKMMITQLIRASRNATLALASLTVIATTAWAQDGGLPVGTKAPAAAVQMMDGTSANLSQFIGKTPVVMEFWAWRGQ